MDMVYVFACGVVWGKTGVEDAGQELIHALGGPDPDVSLVAEVMLVEAGPRSIPLLEEAVMSGVLGSEKAEACLEALFRPTWLKAQADCTVVN